VKYFLLLRPKDWAKNLFLLVPLFFSGQLFHWEKAMPVLEGILAFSLVSSCIYIINDFADREDDKKHPLKSKRPLAAGTIKPSTALALAILLILAGLTMAYFIRVKFLFVLSVYFVINLSYSLGLKNIAILDVILIATGFVLRIKAGAVIAWIGLSEWLNILVFLLALFMAIGKRRDDVLLRKLHGTDMRKSISGYNLELLNTLLAVVCGVLIVSYFMYTMSAEAQQRLGTYRLYYTCLFVIAGIMRYLQIIYVQADSGSPVKILYKDRFIQLSILLWIVSFYLIIYVKDLKLFQ
jgi:decaprenyl-phosphate phosphoribosyltransferase